MKENKVMANGKDEEKKIEDFLNEQQEERNKILGYGIKLKVLIGKNEDKSDNTIEYHFTPVVLSDIPMLVSALNSFGKSANTKNWSAESLKEVAKIIQLSLKKMHGEIDIATILKQFDFGSLARAVRIAINLNDFLSEMQAIKEIFSQVKTMEKKMD